MYALDDILHAEADIQIAERSLLYNLLPKFLGTQHQESLLSYLVRLARAHCLSPRDLIKHVLGADEAQIKSLVCNSFYAEYSGPINGLGFYAKLFSRILNKLTARDDLQLLTMLPWEDVIPAQSEGFLARCPRWCPMCYGDQLQNEGDTYTPLLWSLAPYKRCIVHGCALEDRCHQCGKAQAFIPRVAEVALCGNCGASLARTGAMASRDLSRSVAPSGESQHCENLLVAMMNRHTSIASEVKHELLCRSLKNILNELYQGNRSRLCHAFGWNAWALNGWLNKGQRVSLPKLLQLGQGFGIDVVDLCSGNVVPGDSHLASAIFDPGVDRVVSRAPRPRLTAQQRIEYSAALQERFANCPAPPPLRVVGHPYGLGRSSLRYWFPDLCKRICEQRIKRRKINAEIAATGRAKIVADAVDTLVRNGAHPARRKVDAAIKKHGLALARPAVFQEYIRAISSQPA
jgi:hypothetical protein